MQVSSGGPAATPALAAHHPVQQQLPSAAGNGSVLPHAQPGIPHLHQQPDTGDGAGYINQAADLAVEQAIGILSATRTRMHELTGTAPSSSKSSDAPHHEVVEDEGSSHGRRRRSSSRVLQEQNTGGSGGGTGKPGKGLRHFSMKVCEKVESKGTTTYNEVADELVAEMKGGNGLDDGVGYDEKNIRRRVYDAINVLMALDIIAKEKKAIIWKGFPASRGGINPMQRLAAQRAAAATEVERKAAFLADLVEQQKALKGLLERNASKRPSATTGTELQLPFILVQAKPDATVEVQISEDMRDVQFDFYK